jgi:hypothetical protein
MRAARILLLIILGAACSQDAPDSFEQDLNPVAERYVRLALALGEHDTDYVDAYFGPPEWRERAQQQAMPLAEITASAEELVDTLEAMDVSNADELLALRHDYILSHLKSLATVSRVRDGLTLSFDEESRLIYGFVAPNFPQQHYEKALERLNEFLPGDGPTHERYQAVRQQFRLPDDKIEAIARAGLDECRRRTLQHMVLPDGEDFEFEPVQNQPWSAYNWYKGGSQGLIQVNLDRPRYLGTSIGLGCHEGYPGHHTFSSLLDERFLQQRGWIEFSVLPLFSPQGMIFEGSGNVASDIAFPGASYNEYLRDVIMPIAGIATADLAAMQVIRELMHDARYASIEAARKFLDGDWSKEKTTEWLTTYALVAPQNMDAWFAFTRRYRAYRINYVLGEDLVRDFVREENPDGDADGDWQALAKLLSLPPTPALFAE